MRLKTKYLSAGLGLLLLAGALPAPAFANEADQSDAAHADGAAEALIVIQQDDQDKAADEIKEPRLGMYWKPVPGKLPDEVSWTKVRGYSRRLSTMTSFQTICPSIRKRKDTGLALVRSAAS